MTNLVALRQLDTAAPNFEAEFGRVLHWSADTDREIEQRVAAILADVRARGDAAVLECTARFDGLEVPSMAALELGPRDFAVAFESITPAQREALAQAVYLVATRMREPCLTAAA
jgi:histidinol dehydrogenase